MTIKRLREILETYPGDGIVMYRHNKYGRIDVDTFDYSEETLVSGEKIKCFTLEADFEEE